MKLSNKVYDVLVTLQFILPCIATLYFVVAGIWGWSYIKEVVATCAALATLVGFFLGLARIAYKKNGHRFDGDLVMIRDDDGEIGLYVALNESPEVIQHGKAAVFKVVNKTGNT